MATKGKKGKERVVIKHREHRGDRAAKVGGDLRALASEVNVWSF